MFLAVDDHIGCFLYYLDLYEKRKYGNHQVNQDCKGILLAFASKIMLPAQVLNYT